MEKKIRKKKSCYKDTKEDKIDVVTMI